MGQSLGSWVQIVAKVDREIQAVAVDVVDMD